MSSILRLAADTLDRIANPAFGLAENEAHGQRLALGWDEDFARRLREEAQTLRRADELTPHGWVWLLEWAPRLEIALDGDLLLELCDRWHVAAMQTAVIAHAVRGRQPDEWLARLVRRATSVRDDSDNPVTQGRHSRYAESVLMALLQVGEQATLAAAEELLATPWPQQRELVAFYRGWLESLDDQNRDLWQAAVHLPPDVEPPEPQSPAPNS